MCLGELAVVVATDADAPRATVDVAGRRRAVTTLLVPDVVPGDHVLVHSGHALAIVAPAAAEEARRLRGGTGEVT